MTLVRYAVSLLVGFSSGVVIAGAVVAFITVIGIIPRLAQKTSTQRFARTYETSILLGAVIGVLAVFFNIRVPVGFFGCALFSFMAGVFYGCLAMSLAEIINVIPIMTRRGRVQSGMFWFVVAIAVGKCTGSLLYFLVPGFHD